MVRTKFMNGIEKIDKVIFWSLCGYALMSCVSLAGINTFIALTAVLTIVRVTRKLPSIIIYINYLIPVAVFFIALISLVIISPDIHVAVERFWRFAYGMFPFIATLAFIKDKWQLKQLAILLMISVTVADFYAIWQGMHGDYRASAFFKHPMDLAGILVQFLPMLVLIALDNNFHDHRKYIVTALLIGSVVALYNGTRGLWIALGIVIPMTAFMYLKDTKKKLIYVSVGLIAVGILMYSVPPFNARMATVADKSYQSNSERILMWNSAWKMFNDNPIAGVGLGQYAEKYQTEYISPEAKERGQGHAHNNFLQLLAETGLIGFLSFCFMFGAIIFNTLKDWRKYYNTAALMFFAATCGILIQGFTEFNFGNRIVMTFYFFIMALYLQYRNNDQQNLLSESQIS